MIKNKKILYLNGENHVFGLTNHSKHIVGNKENFE